MSCDLRHCFRVTRYDCVVCAKQILAEISIPPLEVNHSPLGPTLFFCFCSTLFPFELEKFFAAADFAFGTFVYLLLSVSVFVFYLLGNPLCAPKSKSKRVSTDV